MKGKGMTRPRRSERGEWGWWESLILILIAVVLLNISTHLNQILVVLKQIAGQMP